jgi:hypothetical protein
MELDLRFAWALLVSRAELAQRPAERRDVGDGR